MDMDILLLQVACIICGGDAVFDVLRQVCGPELALRMMVVIVSDRMGCGATAREKNTRCVIHALAVKDAPFSEIESHTMPRKAAGDIDPGEPRHDLESILEKGAYIYIPLLLLLLLLKIV